MDNAPFHKIHEVKRIVLARGHFIKYLPPYSLFLNPIENMFAAWKEYVRRARPTSEIHLMELIKHRSILITEEDCNG